MNAIILSIGDELVLGQTIDTNSAWLSRQLAGVGCAVSAHMTVPDDQRAIEEVIRDCIPRCRLLLISGGIGPTPDDLTRQALAAVMEEPLELNRAWLEFLHDFFEKRGRPMPEANRIQAMIPRTARIIENSAGTAAGIHASVASARGGSGDRSSRCEVFILPGVPKEMRIMFERSVLPLIAGGSHGVILSRSLHTFGVGESAIAEMLGPLLERSRNPSVGTTVANGIVSIRINARFDSPILAREKLAEAADACRRALGDLVFGEDDQTLPESVADLLRADPQAQRWAPAVCTAESCTGGLLAKYLTDVPGSSTYFRQGWVTYDNEAKRNELGVSAETIGANGAVSEATVIEMARGAVARCGARFALAISGIAGPSGGSDEKPVGTVCIALAYPADGGTSGVLARTFLFPGDREMIRDRAAKMALTMLRFQLLRKPLPC